MVADDGSTYLVAAEVGGIVREMGARRGRVVHRWQFDDYFPWYGRLLPNGNLFMRATVKGLPPPVPVKFGEEHPPLAEHVRRMAGGSTHLLEVDWDGNVVWEFYHPDYSLLHHDQRKLPNGNYLGLAYRLRDVPSIAPFPVKDDIIFEVTPEGQVVWEWSTVDHFDQLGFDEAARSIMGDPDAFPYNEKVGDLFHTNSIQPLPENKFFDRGKDRFRPGNILVSQRNTNIIFIIDRETGDVVWKMGPRDGFTIGQHDPNMIEKGLKGAGNILVFDNGGRGGYPPERYRPYTRVIEINPAKREIVWEYDAESSGAPRAAFFTEFTGNARRLPNDNTMITESSWGRVFEVDREGTVVWEWMSPHVYKQRGRESRKIPRCYRVGPDWPVGPFNNL
jgi:hypothetical protein